MGGIKTKKKEKKKRWMTFELDIPKREREKIYI